MYAFCKVKIILLVFILSVFINVYAQDTIVVQIAHGSKPKKAFSDEHKTIGGYLGGHVVIQIDNHVYGFFFKGKRIHIFPHNKNKNGVFQKESITEWNNITKEKKLSSVYIPISKEEKQYLLDFYTKNLKTPSYDYAFFGKRCAASCYNNLKAIGKINKGNYFFNAFYPKRFRKKLLRQSKKYKYKITVKEGSSKRKWEGG